METVFFFNYFNKGTSLHNCMKCVETPKVSTTYHQKKEDQVLQKPLRRGSRVPAWEVLMGKCWSLSHKSVARWLPTGGVQLTRRVFMDLVFKWNVLIISTLKLRDARDSSESSVNSPPSAQGLWSWQRIDPHALLLKPQPRWGRPSAAAAAEMRHTTPPSSSSSSALPVFEWRKKTKHIFSSFALINKKLKKSSICFPVWPTLQLRQDLVLFALFFLLLLFVAPRGRWLRWK